MAQEIDKLLPEDFLESLSLVPDDQPVTLLTRHSIREQAENYNAHHSLPLTEEGVKLASHWGGLQPFEEFQLFSSPIGRCVETARHMHVGKHEAAAHEVEVEIIPSLAEPGCFIPDIDVMRQVGEVFVKEGPIVFMNKIISGAYDHLIAPRGSVSGLLKQFKDTHNQKAHSLNIHVSHDTILAAFVYSLLKKSELDESDWPRMMEGVYLWFDDKRVMGVWRGNRFEASLSDFNE